MAIDITCNACHRPFSLEQNPALTRCPDCRRKAGARVGRVTVYKVSA